MQALVSGGTGFIGSHVVRALRDAGWQVRCLVRPSSPRALLRDLEVTWVEGDVRDLVSVREAARGCDAVFHLAAYYALWSDQPASFHEVNVEGTRNVLRAAREAGVQRVVHTSSVACVGQAPPGGLADEETRIRGGDLVGPYERSKHLAEQEALAAAGRGLDVVIVNPTSTIGPGDLRPTPTGKIVQDFLRGRMPFFLETGLNFVDVRDVAQGHLLAWERGRSGRRYILGSRAGNLTLRDFLSLLGEVSGQRAPRLRLPYAAAWFAGRVSTALADRVTGSPPLVPACGVEMARRRMFFDPGRAIVELGLPQTPLRQTALDAVTWFRTLGGAPAGR